MPLRFLHPIQRVTHQLGLYLEELPVRGLTQSEAHILALLARSSPLSVAELHRGLAHKRSTLTSILDRLTHRGLITRQTRAVDRRSFAVSLTARGRKLAQRIDRHLAALERKVANRLGAADLKGFDRVMAALENLANR